MGEKLSKFSTQSYAKSLWKGIFQDTSKTYMDHYRVKSNEYFNLTSILPRHLILVTS